MVQQWDTPVIDRVESGLTVEKGPVAVTAATTKPLFTVSGGRVRLLSIIGEVTTAIQDTANNTKVTATATGESAVDICANLDIADDAVGTLYTVTGVAATAMQSGFGVRDMDVPFIVKPGSIGMANAAASATGAIQWTAKYVPVDPGARLVAA